uniref:Uncharacterized protein n=1 Tax=Panagrolaimus sp. ES5 TaxID=591445 RepID=A0AC34FXQ1_9BILA
MSISLDNFKPHSLVAYLSSGNNNDLRIVFVDFETKKFIPSLVYCTSNVQKCVYEIPNMFKNKVKAVICHVSDLQTKDFDNNLSFCEMLKNILSDYNIPNYFVSADQWLVSSLIIHARITDIKANEILLLGYVNDDFVATTEYCFTKNGYKKGPRENHNFSVNDNPENVRQKILGTCKPKKILLYCVSTGNARMKYLRSQVLKSMNLVYLETLFSLFRIGENSAINEFVVEMTKWLLDKSYSKFYVFPSSDRHVVLFSLHGRFGEGTVIAPDVGEPLIVVHELQCLPFTTSIIAKKPFAKYTLTCSTKTTTYANVPALAMMPHSEIYLNKKCHRSKITFTMDDENFPSCKTEPIIIDAIRDLPTTLKKTSTKNPVIGFFDQCSVICVFKSDSNEYEFLDDADNNWNGMYGNELLISFAKEKPVFGEKAKEDLKVK